MVGPGDEITPHAGGHGHLRASDADRAHVIDTLKAAYVDGLVTKDEFDARVSQTFASRTHAELAPVTADLPAGLAVAQQRPSPAPAGGNAPEGANVGPGGRAILAAAVFAGLALVISVSAGPFASTAAFLLLLGGAGGALVSLFLLGTRMRGSRRDKRSGGQLPPQRGTGTGPGVPSPAISAASAEEPPHASKPRRRGRANKISRPGVADTQAAAWIVPHPCQNAPA
jgi:hypothetical protein